MTELLTPAETARILETQTETLAVWRSTQRYNLPYVKIGRLVRYRKSDIETFIESRLQSQPK